ncbi:hypothetical protein C5167_039279 [Papaver somniferum]|uniref:Senescence regulator S40 n=1 Tax=Papaver somniferum TaxID=3469 RepID=A0A4Y7IFY1_PAPSO|nr:uncharacterized protein LOC113305039 [Papaver somniferum]RZC46335.1 hypothetical protein C5167_039279 [Papaver somniferum]
MAKGRKTGSNRHERFLGTFNYINQNPGNGAIDGSELEEEDIWSMVDDIVDGDDQVIHVSANEWSYGEPPGNGGRGINSNNQRWYEKEDQLHHHQHHRQVGGLSLAFKDSGKAAVSPRIVHQFHRQDNMMAANNQRRHNHHHHQMAASAPVNVPDWTKILRINSVESLHDSDDGLDDDDNSERVPPHEYVARGSRRNTMTTSVFEGVGRTLKGRDLSRVRDAVWSQTGFDG